MQSCIFVIDIFVRASLVLARHFLADNFKIRVKEYSGKKVNVTM